MAVPNRCAPIVQHMCYGRIEGSLLITKPEPVVTFFHPSVASPRYLANICRATLGVIAEPEWQGISISSHSGETVMVVGQRAPEGGTPADV